MDYIDVPAVAEGWTIGGASGGARSPHTTLKPGGEKEKNENMIGCSKQ